MRNLPFRAFMLLLPLASCGGGGKQPINADALAGAVVRTSPMDSINALIVQRPGDASLYAVRSGLYQGRDSLQAAQRDLETAVRLDSTQISYRLDLGDLYYRTVQVDKARAQFERVAALDPKNIQALLKLAEIQLMLRNYGKSMTLVNAVITDDEHAARAYFIKGWIHMETGDTALALSSLRTAVEQDPQDYTAYMMLATLSAKRHDPLAVQYFNTAITLRPRSVEAWYGKAMFLQENGRDSAALDCYARITEIDSTNPLPWYNSGYVRMEHLNDPLRAKSDFSQAIRISPGYVDAWYNRGLAMERIHELDSAAANYQIAIKMKPDHALAAAGLDRLQAQGVRIKIREHAGKK